MNYTSLGSTENRIKCIEVKHGEGGNHEQIANFCASIENLRMQKCTLFQF